MRKIKLISFLIIAYTALSPNFICATATIKRLPSRVYGVVDENDKTIIPYNYRYIKKDGNYYIVKNNDLKYGVFTEEGQQLIPCEYNLVYFHRGEFCVTSIDNLAGIVDTTGTVIIEPEYESVSATIYNKSFPSYNVELNGLRGIVKPGNQVLVPARYTSLVHLINRSTAQISWGLYEGIYDMDNQKELITPNKYLACERLKNGYYYGRLTGGQVELINPSGNVVWRRPGYKINWAVVETVDNPHLHGTDDYTQLYQIIWPDGQSYVVDTTGLLVDSVFSNKILFRSVATCLPIEKIVRDTIHHASFTLFSNDRCLWGAKNMKGEIIIPCKYDKIDEYTIKNYGFFKCQHEATMALYDITGKCIIPEGIYTDYERLYKASEEQLIHTISYGKAGLCDINGNCLIPADTYTDIRVISNSTEYLYSYIGKKEGLITYQGKEVLPPAFENVSICYEPYSSMQNNAEYTYFEVKLNGLRGAYSTNSNLIIPPKYSQIFYKKGKNLNYFNVENGDTEGIIDTNGNVIIPSGIYSDIHLHESDMSYFSVKLGDKAGCYDIHGNMLVAPSDYHVCYIYKSTEYSTGYKIYTKIMEGNKPPLIQEFELYTNVLLKSSQQEELRKQYIKKADDFFELDKFAKAAEQYSEAIKIRPTDYLYFNRAVSYYNNKQYDKAIPDFQYVLSITANANLAYRSNELIEEARAQKAALSERKAAIGSIILGTLLGVTAAAINSALPTYQNNNAYNSYIENSNTTNDSYDNNDYMTDTNTKSTSTNLCLKCYGNGKCPQCHGSGCRTDNMFGTGTDCEHDCGICGGDGVCTKCGGQGRL